MTKRSTIHVSLLLVAGVVAGACDAIIGIEDLSTPPQSQGIACDTPDDCPVTGNPCFLRACTSEGLCELREVESGYQPPDQTPGDCLGPVCFGSEVSAQAKVDDVPSDGNTCTIEGCNADGSIAMGFTESGTECPEGAGVCDGQGNCVACVVAGHCGTDQDCIDNQCVGVGCSDGSQNGNETGEDCGGIDCLPCEAGEGCLLPTDCESLVCLPSGGAELTCQEATCEDETQNGDETDIDCGGSCEENCGVNHKCEDADDCNSGVCRCTETACLCAAPRCDDGVQNGSEIDIDCGALCVNPPTCEVGRECQASAWCESKVCDPETDTCAEPSCDDNVANGLESGIDCCCMIDGDPPTFPCDDSCEQCSSEVCSLTTN
jgi:hypothetical protein